MRSLNDYDMKIVHIQPNDIIFVQLDADKINPLEREQIEHAFMSVFNVKGVIVALKKIEVTILRNETDWVGEILDGSENKN